MKLKILIFLLFSLQLNNLFSQEKNIESNEQLKDKYKTLQKEKKELRNQIDGSVLEELNFEDINGKKHSLESLRGKIVVLNFWFIQCKPCVEEFPDLNELKIKFKGKRVEFFAVSWNDKNSLTKFLKTNKLEFTVVSDRTLNKKFEIPYYPYNVIIDKNGKVEYVNDFLSLNVINKIERKINKLL